MADVEEWEKVAIAKRKSLIAEIPTEWILSEVPSPEDQPNACHFLDGVLAEEENIITHSTISDLTTKISDKTLTATKITQAFCHRAALSHQLTNCLSEIFFEKALSRAQELDDYFERTGQLIGPLHGIPISLKDQFNIEGIESCKGFVSQAGIFKTKEEESDVVKILRKAGAVFYVKTAVPMGMMSYETYSNLLGHTLNGINRKVSCGGSSGGEGALISTYGSIAGIGTDLGGSLRTPAGFNGIHSIRCSTGRFPGRKAANAESGSVALLAVVGPMTQNLEDLRMVSEVLVNAEAWNYDARTLPIPWKKEFDDLFEQNAKFSFGMLQWDGVVKPHPPIKRVMDLVKVTLLKDGHEVIDLEPQNHKEILETINGIYASGASQAFKEEVAKSGEPLSYSYKKNFKHVSEPYSCIEYWKLAQDRYKYQQAYDAYWLSTANVTNSKTPIDAIISPLWGSTSFEPGKPESSPSTYTRWLNIIDYSTVVIPVSKINKEIEEQEWNYKPTNSQDQANYDNYNLDLFDQTPISIQLSTKRYEEEKAIYLAKVVDACLKASAL